MADLRPAVPLSQVELHSGAIKRLEMHMSYVCDQACGFCSESDRMRRFARDPISYASMAKTLARKRRDGCEHVTFTGGEPTLHPRFPDVLRAAKRLGYRTYATSDGQRLADEAYAAEVLPLLDELCLSVHGDRPEVHDPLVLKDGSFARVLRAIGNVAAAPGGPYLLTNTVMTRENLGAIVPTVRLLASLGPVRHCTISNLAPDGDALRNYERLAPRLSDIEALIPALGQAAREGGVVLRFFGVPICLLGDDWDLPNDLHWSPRVTVERGLVAERVGLQEIHSPNPGRMRFFAPRCSGCSLQGRCWGIFEQYARVYGDAELRPRLP